MSSCTLLIIYTHIFHYLFVLYLLVFSVDYFYSFPYE